VAQVDIQGKVESEEGADEQSCWNYLMTVNIPVFDDNNVKQDMNIAGIIELITAEGFDNPLVKKSLPQIKRRGILIEPDAIYVASQHSELSKILARTRWSVNWCNSLLRLPGAEKARKRIGTINPARCTKVPI